MRFRTVVRIACVTGSVLLSLGCISSQLEVSSAAYYVRGPEASLDVLGEVDVAEKDRYVAAMEASMSLLELGRYEESNILLQRIAKSYDADLDGSDYAATLLANDEAGTYRGESFEQVYVHTLMMANALAVQNAARAAVAAEEALETINGFGCNECVYSFTRYLAALSFAYSGQRGRAEEAILEAVVENPRSDFLQAELERIGGAPEFEEEAGFAPPMVFGDRQRRVLYVVLMLGKGPMKVESALPVPNSHVIAWPKYEPRDMPIVAGSEVRFGLRRKADSAQLTDMLSLAQASLSQRSAALLAKEIGKTAFQEVMAIHIGDDHGGAAEFFARFFFSLADHADLRHWSSLPATCHVIRARVPDRATQAELRYTSLSGEVVDRELFDLPPEWRVGPLFVVRRMP